MAISIRMLTTCRENQKKASESLRKWFGPHGKHLSWLFKNMQARCYNPRNSHFRFYGAVGIGICAYWRKDRRRFYQWAIDNGYKPGIGLSIERKNVRKNYSPGNCCFIPHVQQCRNQTRNLWLEWNGRRMIASDWSRELGFKYDSNLARRIRRGWSVERALTTPP